MLEKLDGVILAVRDADGAAKTFEALFGTTLAGKTHSDLLDADVTSLACGTDLIRLATPTGPGPLADRIDAFGEGIVGVVFATKDLPGLVAHIESNGVDVRQGDPDAALIDPARTHGLITMVTRAEERESAGIVSFLYEVTHLVRDWKAVSDFWTRIFGLDGAKFSPISSDQYGYEGMLTLFDPPDKLDRIEVVYPHDTEKAMGRFFLKRGEGPYMFFMECADTAELARRLDNAGARYAGDPAKDPRQSLFVHPSATHGVLIGVSPTNQAWTWSGRPELARAGN